MKAAVYDLPGRLRLTEIDAPQISQYEILIEQKAAGLSTSDIHSYRQGSVSKLYHKNAGVVAEVGSKVHGFNLGDWVYYDTFINCGRCQPCREGFNNLCQKRSQVLPDSIAYAEYVRLPKELVDSGGVYPTEGLSFEDVTNVGPLSNCVHSLEKMRARKDEMAVIIGAGYMGLMHLRLLQGIGIDDVTVVEVNEDRISLAMRLGAEKVVNPQRDEVEAEADLVIVCTSNPLAMKQSTDYAGLRGRVNFFGGMAMVDQSLYIELNSSHIHYRELEIMGTYSSISPRHYTEAIELVRSGKVSISGLNTNRVSLDGIDEMFSLAQDPSELRIVITS